MAEQYEAPSVSDEGQLAEQYEAPSVSDEGQLAEQYEAPSVVMSDSWQNSMTLIVSVMRTVGRTV